MSSEHIKLPHTQLDAELKQRQDQSKMTEHKSADHNAEISIEDEIAGREKMLQQLPKLCELMLEIPVTHRERMLQVLRVMLGDVP